MNKLVSFHTLTLAPPVTVKTLFQAVTVGLIGARVHVCCRTHIVLKSGSCEATQASARSPLGNFTIFPIQN